ncbi:MAG: YobA family protein [Blautia sp.]|nr:YobA family protein [Lachnoclostridium sp.]MCM1210283.1 YobA family protein [Blautia sp.]
MKKKLYSSIYLWCLAVITLCACGKQGNPIVLPDREEIISSGVSDEENVEYSPNTEGEADDSQVSVTFQATVIERNNDTILVKPVDGSLELNSADKFSISNEEELELQVGDLIEIAYNGDIMESYPAQLGKVYTITVIEQAESNTMWDRIPMVRVNGKLYYDTGKENTIARCGNMDGQITTTVDGSEIPMEDNQSNFGSGFGYQFGEGDTIEVYMNEKWFVFERREE